MKHSAILICAVWLGCVSAISVFTPRCTAGIIPLVVDSTNSFLDLDIAGVQSAPDVTSTSGSATIDLPGHTVTPGSSVQLTSLDLTLDSGLDFGLGLGFAASTEDSDVEISLVTPGAAGTIVGGTFNQLANQLAISGIVTVTDFLGLAGGNQTIDLSTLGLVSADFNDISISQTGSVFTVTGDLDFSQPVELGGATVQLDASGQFVASGVKAVPEPNFAIALIAWASLLMTCRRRSAIA